MTHYAESLALRRKIGDRAGIAASLRNLALIHSKQGNDRLANEELDESLEMALEVGEQTIAAQAHLAMSEIERTHGSPRQAIVQAREALGMVEKAGNLELQRQAWGQLAASQERAGDYASAVSSLKMFQQVTARIFDAERTRRVELLERRYQVERRESEIAQLRAQQATAELSLSRRENQRNVAIGAAALFASLGIYLYRRRTSTTRTAQHLSVTDTLTGLKNRRYVLETIATDIAVSERRFAAARGGVQPLDADLVFFLVDIDHFKSVNERLGHEAGDRVLVQLANALAKACRSADTLARWGGEEFLVIGRFTHRGAASISAERLRRAVEGCVLDAGDGRTLQCTCCGGLCELSVHSPQPARADVGAGRGSWPTTGSMWPRRGGAISGSAWLRATARFRRGSIACRRRDCRCGSRQAMSASKRPAIVPTRSSNTRNSRNSRRHLRNPRYRGVSTDSLDKSVRAADRGATAVSLRTRGVIAHQARACEFIRKSVRSPRRRMRSCACSTSPRPR